MQLALSLFAIFLFICLVLVHEWGHFKAARRGGVDVEEYGLGLPPRIKGVRLKSGLLMSINWLPIGGFVKLKGEHDSATSKGSFGAASLGTKTRILLAGVTANFVVGIVLLTVVAWMGTPQLIDNQFKVPSDSQVVRNDVILSYIEAGSPAEKAGLKNRDKILAFEKQNCQKEFCNSVKNSEELHKLTTTSGGQKVRIKYERDGQQYVAVVTLRSDKEVKASQDTDDPKGYLGVIPTNLEIRRSTWSAPIVALGFTGQLVGLTAQGLWHALAGLGSVIAGTATGNSVARQNGQDAATSQVGGPVAIATILWGSGGLGINFVLWVIAIISLTLAIMNILPIPALDGGRLAMILYSRKILKRPLARSTEERLTGMGMAVLLILIALITLVDVKRFY